MSTPQLFLLLLLHFILFIPTSITLHSGKADFKPMLKKNTKKKSLVPLLGLLLRGVEKPACSPHKDEETDVLLVAV